MRLRIDKDGIARFKRIPIEIADLLLRVPELLESQDERARARLLPRTFSEPAEEAQWQRLATPDLAHLIASRAELVRADLAALEWEADGPGDTFRLAIPAEHRAAWEAALNGAAQSLYGLCGFTAEELESEPGELDDPERDVALFRMKMLGWFLSRLLLAQGFQFPDDEAVEGWEPTAE